MHCCVCSHVCHHTGGPTYCQMHDPAFGGRYVWPSPWPFPPQFTQIGRAHV